MLRPAFLFLWLTLTSSLSAQVVHGPAHAARPTTPSPASAPRDTGEHTVVSGFVLDSLTNAPVVGATVMIAGTTYTATTDNGGRFRFELDSLPDGVYTIGFFHPALDSLGITPPPQRITVHRGASVFVQLGVPSMPTIVRSLCPDTSLTDGRGLVMGVVRDAATDKPLGGVRVVLMWTGLNVAANAVLKVPRAVSVMTDANGAYHACGVSSGTRVRAQARGETLQSGWVDVDVPAGGLVVRNFLLGTRPVVAARQPADTGAAAGGPPSGATTPAPLGDAILVGTVKATNGKPLEGAQILLLGTRLTGRTGPDGAFRMGGLPAGTQSVEVREVGYAPRRYAVDLSPHRESRLDAVLEEHAQVLRAIEVTARKGSDIPGFERRRKFGMGTYLTRDDIEKRGAISTTDLFRGIPGVQVMWDGSEYVVQMTRSANMGWTCPVQYYIDGSPFLASSADDMDRIVQPDEIEAIEVYKSATETPAEFQGVDGGACGTIVIWTRRGSYSNRKR